MRGGRGMPLPPEEEDHYAILGLPSGEDGAKLSVKEIERAYKIKARECHPDKRRDDPAATAAFQRLVSSFEILKDEAARKAFDDFLRARRECLLRESRRDAKRSKLTTDLEERERAASAGPGLDPVEKARREEAEAAARLKQELARFKASMLAKKNADATGAAEAAIGSGAGKEEGDKRGGGGPGLDKEMVLKVSWERAGGEYTEAKLREIFARFGEVADVMVRSKGSKKKGSALVVMATKAAAVAAVQNMSGSLSNPLHVLPLQPAAPDISGTSPVRSAEPVSPKLSNLVGLGYQAYEDSVLKKLQKAAEKQKS